MTTENYQGGYLRADDNPENCLGDYIHVTMPQFKHGRMYWAGIAKVTALYAVDLFVDDSIVMDDKWRITTSDFDDAKQSAQSLLDAYYEQGFSYWDFVSQNQILRGRYHYVTENEVINGCTWWAGVDMYQRARGEAYRVEVYMDNESLYDYQDILLDNLPEAVDFAIEMMHKEQADYHGIAQSAKAAGDAIEELSEVWNELLAQPMWLDVDVSFEGAVARINDDIEPEVDTAEYMNWLISRTVKSLMQSDNDIRDFIVSEFAPYKDLSDCREFTNGCSCCDSCAFGVNTNASE